MIISKRGMVPEDILKIKSISDPQVSPNGKQVAYVMRLPGVEKYYNNIYTISTSGGIPVNLTKDGKSSKPRWSPNGDLLSFTSIIDSKQVLCVMAPDGSNRKELVPIQKGNYYYPRTGEDIAWAPDGSQIAYIGTDDKKKPEGDIIVVKDIQYKGLSSYVDGRRNHIFTISPIGGKPEKVTSGEYDEHTIFWSPDSKEIGFISNRTGKRDYNNETQVYSVNLSSKKVRQITKLMGTQYTPQWSPDGEYIAFTALTRPETGKDSMNEDGHIWVIGADGSNPRDLTLNLDRRCSGPFWVNRENLIFTAQQTGRIPIYKASINGRLEEIYGGDFRIGGYGGGLNTAGGKIVFTRSDPVHPSELWCINNDGSEELQITHENNPLLNEVIVNSYEHFSFSSFDEVTIHGWVLKPIGFEPGKKYPTLLSIHGGPNGMYGWSFSDRQQQLASMGYVVLMVDCRGSTGYGQKFSDGCIADWGGGDYKDLMAGVDYALAHFDYVDPDRLGVLGGSYGGYMTNWVITQTDRFKTAVSSASISNLFSMYGNSMKFITIEIHFGGLLWEEKNRKLALERSPALHLENVKTPTLFLHGEVDFTCPVTQAEEMFRGLKRLGVETEMVLYRKSSHGGGWSINATIDRQKRTLEWLNKYLQ